MKDDGAMMLLVLNTLVTARSSPITARPSK